MNSKFFNAVSKIRYLALLMFLTLITTQAWGLTATYTITSKTAVSQTGTAPANSSASYSQTYANTAGQATKNNSMTLTLSGYDGCTITGVSVSVHNNKSSGAGSAALTINGESKGTISSISGLGTSWTDKAFTVTSTQVATKGTIVVTISCSTNSVFCQSFTITYTAASACTNPTISSQPTGATYTQGASASALSVTASGTSLTYQWYSNTSNSTTGASSISGATNRTYTPSTSSAGTTYYYCVVSSGSCSTTSNIVGVTVNLPNYIVTYNAGTGTCATTSFTQTAGVRSTTLPTATPPATCTGWSFAGWCTASAGSEEDNTTSPGSILTGSYTPTSNITLYAVYTKAGAGGGTATLTKMVAGNTLADGDKIIVVANGTDIAMYQETTSSSYVQTWDCSTLNATSVGADDKNWWDVTETTGGFYLGDEDNGYLNMSSNNLYCNSTQSIWTLSDLDDGTFRLQSNGRNLSYRSDLSTTKWRMGGSSYGTSGNTILDIYKYSPSGGSTTYYMTSLVCCTPLGTINGPVNLTQLATPDPTKLKATWSMTSTTGISSYTLEVYNSSNTLVKTINNYTSGAEITGLTPCTEYYVKLYTVSSGSTYCDGGLIGTSTSCTTNGYTLTVNKSNVTRSSGSEPTNICANVSATYSAAGGYSLPTSITVTNAGAQNTGWTWNSSTGVLTINKASVTGNVTVTITGVAASCSDMYTFAYGATPNGDGKNIDGATKECFTRVGSTNEYQIIGFTIPTTTQYYWVGYNGYFYDSNIGPGGANNSGSQRNQFKYLPVANLQGSSCSASGDNYYHAMAGAYGTLRIYSNYSDKNLYVGFVPAGYFMRVGSGSSWSNIQLTQEGSSAVWKSAVMDMDAATIAKKYYINIYSGASYDANSAGVSINSWTNGDNAISTMQRKTNSGNNWANGVTAGSRGFFRVWTDNCAANGYTHFVPTHRIIFHSNYPGGGGPADTYSVDVSVEETNSSIALASAPTNPTGYTFDGWYTAADGGTKRTGNQTISAGATADVELYAHWTANTINLTLDKNNSDASGSTSGSATINYNATALNASPTHATRSHYELEGYYAESGCTHKVLTAAGALVNYSGFVESGKWVRNSATTLYAKWTPVNYTVTWYAGGTAAGNITTAGSPSTSVAYGSKVTTLPTDPDGSPCDKTFVGWTNTTSYTHGTSTLFTDVAGSPAIEDNTSFYAVFAEVSGSGDFELVTSVTQLSAGDEVTIASVAGNSQNGAVIKAYNNGNNWPEASVTTSATGTIAANTTDMQTFTLEAGTVTNSWAFYDGTGYPYAASSGSNYMKREAEKSANSSFSITIDGSTSVATIVAQGNYTRNVMQYNSSSNLFACYSSASQASVYLYKKPSYTGHTITCSDCGTSVTPTFTAAPAGGTVVVTKGGAAVTSGSTVKTCESVAFSVTLTPAAHYTLTGFTATGLTTGTATISPNVATTLATPATTATTFTVTVSAGATGTLTLTPTFTAETPLTITFDVPTGMGTAGTIGTVYSGDNFDFPNVTGYDTDCVDFIGWVDATNGSTFPNDGTATSEPAGLFKYNDNSGAVTTDKTYKAVYGEKVTDYAESYAKVTSAPANWANDHYLIVYEDGNLAFDGSLNTLDAVSNNVAVTITAGTIPYSTTLAASEFRIAAITGGYSIQSASGKYIGTSSDANSLEASAEAILNTLSISDGNFDAVSNSAHLRYNAATNQTRFRYYKSSSYTAQQAVQLYKYGMNEVVTYTYTTAPACGDKYFVTLASVTGGSPTASPKAAADGTTINIVANPNDGYTFTGWTITKTTGGDNVTSTLLGANSTTESTSFTMPAYDVTVTAAYSITDYTITYNNLNGASNTNPTSYTVATADINLADPGERSGYVFKGWYDAASGGNQVTTIANGSTGNVTLWARWAVGYTITWQNGVGATNPTPTGIEDGQAVGTLPVPTGSCELNGVLYSNFVGWYTGTIADVATDPSEAGTLITSATVPNGNVTYHAVYTNMPDYSSTHTSNVTLPASPTAPIYSAKVKLSSEDDAPEYDAIKIGSNGTKTGSFTFTVPSGTTKITLQGVAWNGKTASITLATSVGTITPSTAQSLGANSGATGNSPFTLTSNTTLNFTLANVSSTATITVSNSNERVIVWGINASSASGSDVGYITQCCDNMLTAPVMNSPSVLTSTAITLSWQAVANATGYKVSWNGGDPEDVGTARTYAKTGLEPGTDYSYRVIAKYTTPYCGAVPTEGVVSTKQVYHVTYLGGSGTGECVASGSTTDATAYEAGATVTLQANGYTLVGHQFAAWSSSEVALTALSTSFTMPESDVTITATWTAKQDKFYDLIHDQTATDPDSGDPGTADGLHYYIVRSGCSYTVPSLADDDSGTDNCHVTHEKLLGWIAQSNTTAQADGSRTINADCLNADGTVKSNKLHKGGTAMTANNATFYAVWAVPIEE